MKSVTALLIVSLVFLAFLSPVDAEAQDLSVSDENCVHHSGWFGPYDVITWDWEVDIPDNGPPYPLYTVYEVARADGATTWSYRLVGQFGVGVESRTARVETGWWASGIPHNTIGYDVGIEIHDQNGWVDGAYGYANHP